jgi:hypothetical protein
MRSRTRDYLFSDGDLQGSLDTQVRAAAASVEKLPREQFLATTPDTLVEHIVASHSIEPLVLHEDKIQMDQQEVKIDVSGRFDYGLGNEGPVSTAGHRLTFYLPFTGDPGLWQMRPNMYFSVMPRGQVDASKKTLAIALENTSNTGPEWYKAELQSGLNMIRQLVQAQTQMLSKFHGELPHRVRSAIERRRSEIERMHGLARAFDIPLVKKPGMPDFRPIDVPKRIVAPLPKVGAGGYKPEAAISDESFETILSAIRHAGASFEGTPQTYRPLGEEGLRDNLLSHINVIFEGGATGETFRKYGKTDIRIEEESRCAFVAECKLWAGAEGLLKALEQLLSYLTWRDCKAALVIFNKNVAAFTSVQETVAASLLKAKGCLRTKDTRGVGEWRFVFQSAEDPAREVTLHVFAFNLYVAPERSVKKR